MTTFTKQEQERMRAIAMLAWIIKFMVAWQVYSLTVAAIMGTSLGGAAFGGLLFPAFGLGFAAMVRGMLDDSKDTFADAGFMLFCWLTSAVIGFLSLGAFVFAVVLPWVE